MTEPLLGSWKTPQPSIPLCASEWLLGACLMNLWNEIHKPQKMSFRENFIIDWEVGVSGREKAMPFDLDMEVSHVADNQPHGKGEKLYKNSRKAWLEKAYSGSASIWKKKTEEKKQNVCVSDWIPAFNEKIIKYLQKTHHKVKETSDTQHEVKEIKDIPR